MRTLRNRNTNVRKYLKSLTVVTVHPHNETKLVKAVVIVILLKSLTA
jgi:hypothetical protein